MNELILSNGGLILTIENRIGNITETMPLLSPQIPKEMAWD
jgi:hypothetical protein